MKKLCAGLLVLALAAGCGQEEDKQPTAAERELLTTANPCTKVSEELVLLATDAVVNDGTGGSIKSIRGKAEAPTGTISFSGTVDIDIDLDLDEGQGDVFPNWTGIFNVLATGSVQGDETSGSVTYTVTVTRTTDITLTNPNAGGKWTSVTAPAGDGIVFSLDISWSVTDVENCMVSIAFDAVRSGANALPLVIETPGGTINATLDESVHEELALGLENGLGVFSIAMSGHREVSWTVVGTGDSHTVRVDVDLALNINLNSSEQVTTRDSWTITIDGAEYGPYTTFQFALLLM